MEIKMKYLAVTALFAQLALITVSVQAIAQDGQDCVALSAGLGSQDRADFLKGCLGKKSSPSSVEDAVAQKRLRYCEQNAKNKLLQGKESADYVTTCMAEAAAKKKWAKLVSNTSPTH
jgi:hypothetical protein